MPKVSVIIPFFNEQESLPALFDRLDTVINGATYADIDWEIMMVDDGSTDASPAIVMERRQLDPRIHIVRLSRNFGKEAAMLAGLDSVTGDCAVIMDADLQHPPEVIPEMVERWRAGADDIVGHRLSRGGESRLRYLLTRLYYSLASHLGASAGDLSSGDFRLMSRSMIDALRSIREADRYTKSLYSYVGFRTDSVDYVQEDRRFGTGKQGLRSLFNLGLKGVVTSSSRPLRLIPRAGVLMLLLAVVAACFEWGRWIPALILAVGSVQLFAIALVAEYVASAAVDARQRPPYFIMEKDGEKNF